MHVVLYSLRDPGYEIHESHQVAAKGQLEQALHRLAQALPRETHFRHHVLPRYNLQINADKSRPMPMKYAY